MGRSGCLLPSSSTPTSTSTSRSACAWIVVFKLAIISCTALVLNVVFDIRNSSGDAMNAAPTNNAATIGLATNKAHRLESLDVLRGILAIGVMFYHYSLPRFSAVVPDGIETALHWCGIYGVEAFFVISGMSLCLAYRGANMRSASAVSVFFVRRYFRIAPLFYLALVASLLLKCAAAILFEDTSILRVSSFRIIANVTFVFGAWSPAQSLVPAGWSVGMEMVFYVFCPILLIAFASSKNSKWCALAVSVAMAAYCERYNLDPAQPLAGQWDSYVSVANHFVFFVAGMVVGGFDLQLRAINRRSAMVAVGSFGLLCYIASMGVSDEIELVTGWRRGVLGTLTIGLCISACGFCPRSGILTRLGLFCGNISYSVYLLHYFCGLFWEKVLGPAPSISLISVSVVSTVVAASACYHFVEIPFIRIGRRLSKSISESRLSEHVVVGGRNMSDRYAA